MPPSTPIQLLPKHPAERQYCAKGMEPVRYFVPDIAFAVRVMRNLVGLSQLDLARRMGCPRTYISKIENRRSEPTAQSIDKFASGFNCWPSDLVNLGMMAHQQ